MNSAAVISQACPDCKGKGWIEMKCLKEGEARVCPHCNGSGLTPSGLTPLEKECPSCHGSGQIDVCSRAAEVHEVLRHRPLPAPREPVTVPS